MTIYYFTISALTGMGYALSLKKKENKTIVVYLTAVFLCFTLLASFRYAIGFDYFSYRNIYEIVSEWSFSDVLRFYWYEPLFFMICKLFCMSGCPYQIFLLGINIFLFLSAMNFIYRYSKLPWISVYLYITLQFLAYNMNLIRQSVAVACFLFAYPYLKDRKIVPYTIIIIIGGLFHNSLFLMLPFYFLFLKKNTIKYTVTLIAIAALGYFLFDFTFKLLLPLFPEKYANYLGGYFWSSNRFEYVIPPALYFLLIYLFSSRISDTTKRSIYQNSALYNFLINLFITKHFILERFSIYPFAFSLIAIPDIIYSYKKEKETRGKFLINYNRILILFLFFGAAYFAFAAVKGYHHVYPYISLLNKSRSKPN